MYVIGTAGHVDHGKSTLVEALTGIDPDRLKEEKQRAMTIDLGFAWLTLPSGEGVGVVDVPGHQDFIKNMLAGVGGIDAALFVVAADEGIMPQSREHLAILDLLRIRRGVIAVTKADLIDDEDWLELVQADIAETVAGTILENAPLISVSAMTGMGLKQLLQTLDDTLADVPTRLNRGRPRLPIDRVFSISGFGTIVTGTLLDGNLQVGQEIEILPQGLKSRIRGLQSHKQKVDESVPGSRAAVNLTGLSATEVKRGSVLTSPGWLDPSQLLDTHLEVLTDAPRPLKHNQEIELFTGATQMMGHARLLGTRQIKPGESGWVQLRLLERIPVMKGDRFIIRQPSPSLTIGGGVIVDPLPRRRHRRFQPELISRLEMLLAGTPEDVLLAELDRRGPLAIRTVLAETGLPTKTASNALTNLLDEAQVFSLTDTVENVANLPRSKTIIASPGGWATVLGQIKSRLNNYHQQYPLRLGLPKNELKSRLQFETRQFNDLLQYAQQHGDLVVAETVVRLPQHQVSFTPDQQRTVDQLLAKFHQAPYNTPLPKDVTAKIGDDLFVALLEGGQLIRLSKEVVLLQETYHGFVDWLRAYFDHADSINLAHVRDQFKTSRKYAMALLEYTDEQRLTKRMGDVRVRGSRL
ncbi:selenocysteine-specific translation elongation factor [Anaerolineales bacterium HSG24]|nr:selenocysteine-specific translation elongation factor [Anaerolineales bacterium HSG24]